MAFQQALYFGYFSESPTCDSAVSGNLDELALPNFFSLVNRLGKMNYLSLWCTLLENFKLSALSRKEEILKFAGGGVEKTR